MQRLPAWFRLLRPNQWVKNLFVFAPALFGPKVLDLGTWLSAAIGFFAFCLAASTVYVINDYADVEADRAHPTKRNRPIAAGHVSMKQARNLASFTVAGVVALLLLKPALVAPIAAYLIINMTYSFGLRGVPVVDLVVISLGFVARVWAGAEVIAVPLTSWILADTFFLALYLAAMKRRSEFLSDINGTRESLRRYNLRLINSIVWLGAVGSIVGYAIFAFTVRDELSLTAVFVVLGILRFWRMAEGLQSSTSPTEALVRDRWMIFITSAWVVTCLLVMVFGS